MDLMNTAKLIPVSEWVYALYRVMYWDKEPHLGGKVQVTKHFASSSENHLMSDINEACPSYCNWMSWEVVKENVGHPRVIGKMFGHPVHETALAHGTRLAEQS